MYAIHCAISFMRFRMFYKYCKCIYLLENFDRKIYGTQNKWNSDLITKKRYKSKVVTE